MAISFRSSDHADVISWDRASQSPPAVQPANGGKIGQKKLASWEALLVSMIKSEILPRLISATETSARETSGRETGVEQPAGSAERGGQSDIEVTSFVDLPAFVDLLVADDIEQIRAIADQAIVQCGGREAMLHTLLTPAARLLGDMWEQDACDFTTVTLGVFRLDQIMKETAPRDLDDILMNGHERSILLLPAPGEQHSFGLGMVADAFRGNGWRVRSGPAVTRSKLLRLVRDEWFDVVGLSASSDRALQGLSSYLRAIRLASCNPRVYLLLGGDAIHRNAESARFLGANATATDAIEAVAKVKLLFDSSTTAALNQSIRR